MSDVVTVDLPVIGNDQGGIVKIFPSLHKLSEAPAVREIYINSMAPGLIKGCKIHKSMLCRLKVIKGEITFHIFNEARKKTQSIRLHCSDAKAVIIPPGNWFAFENSGDQSAEFMNFADQLYDPNEQVNEDYKSFDWGPHANSPK